MIQAVVVVNGTRYPVPQQGLRIGRAPENDIVLSDPNISRQHLVVWSTPRGAFLRDLGSQNGTYIAAGGLGPGRRRSRRVRTSGSASPISRSK